ncbi:hypothetical protein JR316_0009298 [Psilocybe cubensis]|uniref:Uncharacterized protein n=2 Tax=Psilocybe cubensis TaxID=181762 RepID=A0A8H8CK55_PSICU|nr:hypothetical protein JR316_0009298 [Psilocybe cubensis]KAH9478836.1 hypothetical protein JR316_0009298 [Psilocybe cubensis]
MSNSNHTLTPTHRSGTYTKKYRISPARTTAYTTTLFSADMSFADVSGWAADEVVRRGVGIGELVMGMRV